MSTAEMKTKAVAPWFGSARMLASEIGKLMGKRAWIGVPFAGGMSELPYFDARTIVANDLHRHVINLARIMADPELGPVLYRKLRRMILHPDELARTQERCRIREREFDAEPYCPAGDHKPDVSWATDYFVASWMGRNGNAGTKTEFNSSLSLRWNANGGDSAVRVQSAVSSIPAWRRALRRASFTTQDAIEFIGSCVDHEDTGIYCDPPFPGPGDAYKYPGNQALQLDIFDAVSRFKRARVVMRFYDHPLIRGLYPHIDWQWNFFKGRTQANKDAPEVLLVNRASLVEGSMFDPDMSDAALAKAGGKEGTCA